MSCMAMEMSFQLQDENLDTSLLYQDPDACARLKLVPSLKTNFTENYIYIYCGLKC